jgi:hypothetical protein
MLRAMSESRGAPDEDSVLGALLLRRLKSIKEGEIAATSKAAGIADRYVRELRTRDSLNVTLSTFEKLLRGLGVSISELVADAPPPAAAKPAPRTVDAKALRPVRRHVKALLVALERLADVEDEDGRQ